MNRIIYILLVVCTHTTSVFRSERAGAASPFLEIIVPPLHRAVQSLCSLLRSATAHIYLTAAASRLYCTFSRFSTPCHQKTHFLCPHSSSEDLRKDPVFLASHGLIRTNSPIWLINPRISLGVFSRRDRGVGVIPVTKDSLDHTVLSSRGHTRVEWHAWCLPGIGDNLDSMAGSPHAQDVMSADPKRKTVKCSRTAEGFSTDRYTVSPRRVSYTRYSGVINKSKCTRRII